MSTDQQSQSNITEHKYKGVRKRKWGKWVSEIRLPNSRERIWLGSYDSPEKAARAFDAALYCLRGRTAKFNFPDSPPDILGGRSFTPSEIQAAAARFANTGPDQAVHVHVHDHDHDVNSHAVVQLESEGTVFHMESDTGLGLESESGSFVNMLSKMDSGNFVSDFGLYYDGMNMGNDQFYAPEGDSNCEENFDVNMDSCLWNF